MNKCSSLDLGLKNESREQKEDPAMEIAALTELY